MFLWDYVVQISFYLKDTFSLSFIVMLHPLSLFQKCVEMFFTYNQICSVFFAEMFSLLFCIS